MNFRKLNAKALNWEFWPLQLVYFPVFLYFFTLINPGIENGGLCYFPKYNLLHQLDPKLISTTIFISGGTSVDRIKAQLSQNGICSPIIAEPDRLERGKGVHLLHHERDLPWGKLRTRPYSSTWFQFMAGLENIISSLETNL